MYSSCQLCIGHDPTWTQHCLSSALVYFGLSVACPTLQGHGLDFEVSEHPGLLIYALFLAVWVVISIPFLWWFSATTLVNHIFSKEKKNWSLFFSLIYFLLLRNFLAESTNVNWRYKFHYFCSVPIFVIDYLGSMLNGRNMANTDTGTWTHH